MTRLAPLALAAVLLALPASAADFAQTAPTAPPPRPAGGEPIDLLYLSDARPVVLRLRVSSDGRPLDQGWDAFVTAFFERLDADRNGVLDGKELVQVPQLTALLTGRVGLPWPEGSAVSRDGLAEYLRRMNLGPFQVPPPPNAPRTPTRRFIRGGPAPTPAELDRAILDLLDADKDGKLSPAELAAAAEIFPKLDADENELVTPEELLRLPAQPPFFVQEQVVETSAGAEFVLLGAKRADPNLARRLLTRYGPKPPQPVPTAPGVRPNPRPANPAPVPRRLTAEQLKLSPEAFAALDQDGDGELDAEELARFGSACGPEVELALRYGKLAGGLRPAEVVAGGKPPVTAVAVGQGAEVALEVPGVRLDITPGRAGGDLGPNGFRASYLNRFRVLDNDGNGYLDGPELQRDPLMRELTPLFDRDGDGKVFEKEVLAVMDETEPLARAANRGIVSTEVAEAGRGLFGLIDADGDGKLSVREIRNMPRLVERFDRDGDGLLSPGEVPRRFQVTFTRGLPPIGNPFGPFVVAVNGRMTAPRPAVGPVWFQKMDRNKDGDVSRREFLGTDEEFRRIDTDGDGLIDAREAEAADKIFGCPAADRR